MSKSEICCQVSTAVVFELLWFRNRAIYKFDYLIMISLEQCLGAIVQFEHFDVFRVAACDTDPTV